MSTLVTCDYTKQNEMRMHKFEQSFLSQNKFQLYFWNFVQLFVSLWMIQATSGRGKNLTRSGSCKNLQICGRKRWKS